jgi:hypothetical protein
VYVGQAPFTPVDDQIIYADILGVNHAVWADTLRQPDREPAAAGPDVRHARALGNAEPVHHLIGLLPVVAIRPLEQSEFFGCKEPRGAPLLPQGRQPNHKQRQVRKRIYSRLYLLAYRPFSRSSS